MGRWPGMVLLVGALVSVAACSDDDRSQSICGSTDHILPSSTLEDLVTYADQVAVVTVVDESDVGGRRVTIEVDEVVWEAPQERAVPTRVSFVPEGGWVDGDPDEGPAPGCDQPPLRVGDRYVVGLVEYSVGEWAPMGGPFMLEVDGQGDVHGVVDDGPLASFDGEPAEAVGRALDDVAPDPAIAPYVDLPGGLRASVAAEEAATTTSTTG